MTALTPDHFPQDHFTSSCTNLPVCIHHCSDQQLQAGGPCSHYDRGRSKQRFHTASVLHLPAGIYKLQLRRIFCTDNGYAASAHGSSTSSFLKPGQEDPVQLKEALHHAEKHLIGAGITAFSVILGLLWLIPLIWLIGTAFSVPSFHMTLFPTTAFTLDNIKYVWNAIPFGTYYINTLTLVVCTFAVQFFTSTLAAYALAVLDFKGQALVFAVIFMQIIIPNDVLITPNFMTLSDLKLIDTKIGMMLPFYGSAMAIFLLRQHFKSIPKALAEAAKIDGANTWQTIWGVYMPCAKPAYLSFAVISVSYHWNNYLWPLIVTNSPTNRTLTVGLAIFAKSKEANMQWANVCAAAFIIIVPLLLAFLVAQKQFMSSFVSAGIKE